MRTQFNGYDAAIHGNNTTNEEINQMEAQIRNFPTQTSFPDGTLSAVQRALVGGAVNKSARRAKLLLKLHGGVLLFVIELCRLCES